MVTLYNYYVNPFHLNVLGGARVIVVSGFRWWGGGGAMVLNGGLGARLQAELGLGSETCRRFHMCNILGGKYPHVVYVIVSHLY